MIGNTNTSTAGYALPTNDDWKKGRAVAEIKFIQDLFSRGNIARETDSEDAKSAANITHILMNDGTLKRVKM